MVREEGRGAGVEVIVVVFGGELDGGEVVVDVFGDRGEWGGGAAGG